MNPPMTNTEPTLTESEPPSYDLIFLRHLSYRYLDTEGVKHGLTRCSIWKKPDGVGRP
jgi:hypothetical protein